MKAIDCKSAILGCLFVAALSFSSCGGGGDPVQFKDTALKSKICEALGKPAGAFLNGEDMTLLENLTAENAGITDLTGIELATNLTELRLPGNEIGNVFLLGQLTKLTRLNLAGNKISNLTSLANLTNLTSLDLSDNRIVDVAPLKKLTRLVELNLSKNDIGEARKAMLEKALPNCSIKYDSDDTIIAPAP